MTVAGTHRVILASAGTGKTYQLSGRFLALLLDGVPPERVLATTFTRKAAGEILDRVLGRLADAGEDAAKLEALNEQLAAEGRPPVTAERCGELLADLARRLHRFRIRTLDAFFVQLAGVFSLELGLPPEWRILDEDEKRALEREALGDALAGAERRELIELLRAMQKTDASRTVERSLLRTVEDCRDAWLDAEEGAWDRVTVPAGLEENELLEALRGLAELELPRTGKGTPVKRWSDARVELLELARDGDWEAALNKGLLAKVADGETSYASKEITAEHRAVLEPLLVHAAHRLLADLRRQNLASREWLARFERAFAGRKDRASGRSFEDIPRALAPADGAGLTAGGFDLGFRLDGRIDHLLLDEFQDTAPPQWRVLAPLAAEIAADHTGERSLFCVGDVKQSIYAWRAGEPRLLLDLARGETFPQLPPPEELVASYRSSPVVLETVDRVFAAVGDSPAFAGNPAHRWAARRWQEGYGPHRAARDLAGAAVLFEAPPREGLVPEVATLAFAAERAAKLVAEAPQATVAILLRRNALVPQAIDLLRRLGLRASGEGGNPLTDSSAVLEALSALHLADHPGDTAAAFHVATSPLAEALGARDADVDAPGPLSLTLRRRLAEDGFGGFLGRLLGAVEAAPEYGPWDAKRFAQLVDLGYAFDRREVLRTNSFLDFVRDTEVDDPSSTQVKVMTIHKSKGLEFDVVLLPELDLSMTLREPAVLRQRPRAADPLAGVSCARSHAVCGLDPEGLGAIRAEEDARHVTEALCLLYVAMTRAAHRLEMIVRPKGQRTPTLSYAKVLRSALGVDAPENDGTLWSHPDSAEAWWPPASAAAPPPEEPRPGPLRFRPPTAPREPLRRSPSAEEGGRRVEPAELLGRRGASGRTRGTLIHRWLEEVEWLEDFDADDDHLRGLARGIEPDPAAVGEALETFRAALRAPGLESVLKRASQPEGDDLEVWRERSFAHLIPDEDEGSEVLWRGTFDRVVLTRQDGRAVRAEILDYKTDRVSAEAIHERAAFYRPQLEGYRRVLAAMTGLPAENVTATLVFLGPDVVVPLDRGT